MSRSSHHAHAHSPLAHGKGTKQRAIGFEFWGRRSALCGLRDPGRYTKVQTHRAERRQAKQQARAADE
jgi:hypothetical protein